MTQDHVPDAGLRRLLDESGVEASPGLLAALRQIRTGPGAAPRPRGELAALLADPARLEAAGRPQENGGGPSDPKMKQSKAKRRAPGRGFLLSAAFIGAMAAGTTGVAAQYGSDSLADAVETVEQPADASPDSPVPDDPATEGLPAPAVPDAGSAAEGSDAPLKRRQEDQEPADAVPVPADAVPAPAAVPEAAPETPPGTSGSPGTGPARTDALRPERDARGPGNRPETDRAPAGDVPAGTAERGKGSGRGGSGAAGNGRAPEAHDPKGPHRDRGPGPNQGADTGNGRPAPADPSGTYFTDPMPGSPDGSGPGNGNAYGSGPGSNPGGGPGRGPGPGRHGHGR